MQNLIVRPAQQSDTPSLLPLMHQLGYPTTYEELDKRIEKFLADTNSYGIALACLDESIIGFVAWSKQLVFVNDKNRFHIEGLVVDEAYRGQGVGRRLMQHVEEIAQNHTPAVIDLTSGLRRAKDGTHEFYKSMGYQNEGPMAKLYLRKEM